MHPTSRPWIVFLFVILLTINANASWSDADKKATVAHMQKLADEATSQAEAAEAKQVAANGLLVISQKQLTDADAKAVALQGQIATIGDERDAANTRADKSDKAAAASDAKYHRLKWPLLGLVFGIVVLLSILVELKLGLFNDAVGMGLIIVAGIPFVMGGMAWTAALFFF